MARNALGRGLGALIREEGDASLPALQAAVTAALLAGTDAVPATGTIPATASASALAHGGAGVALQIDIDLVDPSPYQPRARFPEAGLEELAQSIRTSGIIQPLVVRRIGSRYQLIAGERRWRAAQRAQLLRVPALLKEVSDEQALELTLVENIQREDLNAIEQASAFDRLMSEFHLTQDEVAARTGKDRAVVANTLRLLTLEPQIVQMIGEGKITAGHGRALLGIGDPKLRLQLAHKAGSGKLTVRQLERQNARRVRALGKVAFTQPPDANRKWAIRELEQHLGTQVSLRMPDGKRPGQLILDFYEEGQLQALWDKLMSD